MEAGSEKEGQREERTRGRGTRTCARRARGDVLVGSARGHAWNPEQTIPSLLLSASFPSASVFFSRAFLALLLLRVFSRSANRPLAYPPIYLPALLPSLSPPPPHLFLFFLLFLLAPLFLVEAK